MMRQSERSWPALIAPATTLITTHPGILALLVNLFPNKLAAVPNNIRITFAFLLLFHF